MGCLPLKNEFIQEINFTHSKSNLPLRYFEFPAGIEERPIGIRTKLQQDFKILKVILISF